MPLLRLTCFQSFTATLDGAPAPFRSAKGRALLIYLAVEQERVHQRTTLAGLLWPDEPESRARKNLSQTLLEVRKAIGDADASPSFLHITPQTMAFNPHSSHQLDVTNFASALNNHAYAQAAALYIGPFLEDFSIADSDLFEAWMQAARQRLHLQALAALRAQSAQQEAKGQWEDALQSIRRLLVLAPWQEEAHCQLMRLLASSGQRSAALAQYDTLTQMLMDELGVSPAPETDALYDQILAGEIEPAQYGAGQHAASPPSITQVEAPFQALAPPLHFVGRQAEVEQLRRQMCAPGRQIHAIVGMGGLGKTTLATQLAHSVRGAFFDGVLWANPMTSSPMDILTSWASAYGYDFSQISDLSSRATAVRGILAERQTLIIIDNVNQVSDIEPLLPNGKKCAILFTTRDLDVATALHAETVLLGELAEEEALHLLREILGDARVERELAAAIEICTLCGELPLAVEIAAQRLKSRPRMKLAQLAARLGSAQQRLDLGISNRAVRASFEVSWEALEDQLRQVFALLAVFAGRSFQAPAVAHLAEMALFDVEDHLFSLEALSLVRSEAEERYRQHPLLADFARAKLANINGVYARFSDYFYGFAKANSANFEQLDAEAENIMAALQTAFEQERWPLVIEYTHVLARPWQTRARYSDARRGFAWAQEAAQHMGDAQAGAENLLRWGQACLEQNDYAEAQAHLDQCIRFYRHPKQSIQRAQAQDHLARIAIEVNEYKKARGLLDENLAIYVAATDAAGIAGVYFQQARIDYAKSDLENAKKSATKALEIQTNISDLLGTVRSTRLLAQIYLLEEKYVAAVQYCRQSQTLCEQLNDEGELAITLFTLTAILRVQKKYDQAKTCAEQSLRLLRRMGNLRIEGALLYQISGMENMLGQRQEALPLCLKSVEIFRLLQDRFALAHALLYLGDLYADSHEADQRTAAWCEAEQLARDLAHAPLLAQVQQRRTSYCP